MRGTLVRDATGYRLDLGPAWCRDPNVGAGRTVEVALVPEDPQVDTVASDIREAFLASPPARHAFESLATFYRKAVRPLDRVGETSGHATNAHRGDGGDAARRWPGAVSAGAPHQLGARGPAGRS